MLARKKLDQSLDDLKLAGALAMLTFEKRQDIDDRNDSFEPSSITEILRLNAVPLAHIEINKETHLPQYFNSFPFLQRVESEKEKYYRLKGEFNQVGEAFLDNDIEYRFIKTPGPFPYTSGNLDILVREDDFFRAGDLLEALGCIELKNLREPYKYLYRKFDQGEAVLDVHLHSRIFWGASFLNPKRAISRSSGLFREVMVFTLSADDTLLTTLAHSFYENSGIKLLDLCIVKYLMEHHDFDWQYMKSVPEQYRWQAGYYLALLVYNHLHTEIYGRALFPAEVLEESRQFVQRRGVLRRGLHKMLHLKVTLPFLLPVPLCKRLHYQKILQSEEFGGVFSRLRVMAKVLAEVFFRHLLHIEIQRPALIAFSGMDGSGKTSYATTVKKVCDRCGLRTCYIWSRVGSVTGFQSLTKLISHQGVHPTSSLISPCDVYHKMQGYFAHPEIASIWRAVNIMDLCLFYNLQLRWALWRRRIVICDRYLPDIFTDLFIFTPGRGNPMVWTFLAWCLPKATMNFFLDVPPDTALQRSRNKECLEYLERQSVLYREVQDFANVRRIDVGKELTATCNPLIQELLKGYFEHYETLYLY